MPNKGFKALVSDHEFICVGSVPDLPTHGVKEGQLAIVNNEMGVRVYQNNEWPAMVVPSDDWNLAIDAAFGLLSDISENIQYKRSGNDSDQAFLIERLSELKK